MEDAVVPGRDWMDPFDGSLVSGRAIALASQIQNQPGLAGLLKMPFSAASFIVNPSYPLQQKIPQCPLKGL